MAVLARLIRSLGNGGAVANARRACEERRRADRLIDELAARLASRQRPRSAA